MEAIAPEAKGLVIYLISPINRELMAIYQAEQSGPDQMLLPALM